MNPSALLPDFLSERLAGTLSARVGALVSDPQLTVEIEYRRASKTSYTATTGTQTRTVGKWVFRAVQEEIEQTSKARGRKGDQRFLFMKSEMPIDPRKGDEIRVGADVYAVIKWDSDLQRMMWLVTGRRAGA